MHIVTIQDRYENIRKYCLRAGNLHHEDSSSCHEALTSPAAKGLPPVVHELAMFCDDAMLLINDIVDSLKEANHITNSICNTPFRLLTEKQYKELESLALFFGHGILQILATNNA